MKEDAYVREERLMPDDKLVRTCMMVKQSVQDGDFCLAKALELYKVSQEYYEKFK